MSRPLGCVIASALFVAAAGSAAYAQQRMPRGFVALRAIDPSIRQDIRYAGSDNFTGHALAGYGDGECWLQREAALALKRVQTDLATQNLSLKVYDCYRPARAVAAMARWAADAHAVPDTRRFYPGLDKRRLFALGYIASHSAHSRGVAVDLTLVPREAVRASAYDRAMRYGPCSGDAHDRAPDDSLDMGTSFDCFSLKSRTRSEAVTREQRTRRDLLVRAMARRGFRNYAREWWHFSYPAADPRQEYDIEIR